MAKKFKFESVTLDHSHSLGSGHYGHTYHVTCDNLLCAGKLMSPELFESDQSGGKGRGKAEGRVKRSLISIFQHEMDNLRRIGHPNLVQYLGSSIDPDTQLPIVIMELGQENLTSFLDKSYGSLFYHTQVSLLHDIALGLVFLHAHGVVHGNLSSNNVFVVPYAVPLAKISDYGITRMGSIVKHCTKYRGNSAYLPPDPLTCLQHNAPKVDCYSWGILATQVLTQQLPLPPPKSEQAEVTVSSIEEHYKMILSLVDSTHRLLPLTRSALRHLDGHRPPIQAISQSLAELKKEEGYLESLQRQKGESSGHGLVEMELAERKREVERLAKELSEQAQKIAQFTVMQKEVKQKEKTIEQLRQQLNEARKGGWSDHEKQGVCVGAEDGETCPLRKNTGKTETNSKSMKEYSAIGLNTWQGGGLKTLTLGRMGKGFEAGRAHRAEEKSVLTKEKEEVDADQLTEVASIEKEQTLNSTEKSSTHPDVKSSPKDKLSLTVRVGTSAVSALARGYSAVGESGKIYFTPFSTSDKRIYTCQLHKHSKSLSWMILPECPHFEFGLVIINNTVTAVGGYEQTFRPSQPTNSLLTYSDSRQKWIERYPPMQCKRRLPAVVTTISLLVVAGGNGLQNAILSTVEIMNVYTQQWSTVGDLPLPLTHASMAVRGHHIHIAGGQSSEGAAQVHFSSELVRSSHSSTSETLSAWKERYKTPTLWCTLTSLSGHLLAIGGQDEHKNCSNAMFMYDTKFDIWIKAGSMRHKRSACLAAVPSGASSSVMVVVGGFIRPNEVTNAAEVIVSNL